MQIVARAMRDAPAGMAALYDEAERFGWAVAAGEAVHELATSQAAAKRLLVLARTRGMHRWAMGARVVRVTPEEIRADLVRRAEEFLARDPEQRRQGSADAVAVLRRARPGVDVDAAIPGLVAERMEGARTEPDRYAEGLVGRAARLQQTCRVRCLRVSRDGSSVTEYLHDCGGSFSATDGVNGFKMPESLADWQARHDRVYHGG